MKHKNETSPGIGLIWAQNQYSIKTFKPKVFPFLQPKILMQTFQALHTFYDYSPIDLVFWQMESFTYIWNLKEHKSFIEKRLLSINYT